MQNRTKLRLGVALSYKVQGVWTIPTVSLALTGSVSHNYGGVCIHKKRPVMILPITGRILANIFQGSVLRTQQTLETTLEYWHFCGYTQARLVQEKDLYIASVILRNQAYTLTKANFRRIHIALSVRLRLALVSSGISVFHTVSLLVSRYLKISPCRKNN